MNLSRASIYLGLLTIWVLSSVCEDKPITQGPPISNSVHPISISSNWYEVDYIFPNSYSIIEPQSSQYNVSYLLIGDSTSIMFDTGSGENEINNGTKIKGIVDQLTQQPTRLMMSHFHFDHNQNLAEFETISFPDLPFLRDRVSKDDIFQFTAKDLFEGTQPSQVQVKEWLPINAEIDLGNRIIKVISIPGHTNESIAIIDQTNKLAMLGDFIYNGTLFVFDENDLEKYAHSVDQLLTILDSDYRLYGAHGKPEVEFSKLENLKSFLSCIEIKNCEPTPTNLWGYDVLHYHHQELELVIFK